MKARDRRRSAFVLFAVVFLLNWFLKRVYFIISKIKKQQQKKTSCIYLFFAFYYCIITCAYLPVSVIKCVFVLFQPEQVLHKLCAKTWSLSFWPSPMAPCVAAREISSNSHLYFGKYLWVLYYEQILLLTRLKRNQ